MANPITQEFLDGVRAVSFANSAAIDAFFAATGVSDGFIGWFNQVIANNDSWQGKAIPETADLRGTL